MAIFFFSAISNGKIVPFDAFLDTVFFDDPAVSASAITVSSTGATTTQLTAAAKSIVLDGLALTSIDSFNLMFADGSRLIVGDDSSQDNGSNDSGDNTLVGGDFNDQLLGLDGNDTLAGGLGNDLINGGNGIDTASYADEASAVTANLGLAGAQNTVGAGLDTLIGIENLTGSAFNDTLTGDALNNVLEGGAGNDAINGAAGIDTASYAGASAGVTVSLAIVGAQNTVNAGTDTLVNVENLTGGAFNDTLTGNTLANVLDGGQGNDSLNGGVGDDTYLVESALDVTNEAAAAGIDTVVSRISWTLAANVENLTLAEPFIDPFNPFVSSSTAANGTGNGLNNVITGNRLDNILNGAAGIDMVSYATASAGVNVNLAFTSAQNTVGAGRDTLRNFENLTGSGFDDRLLGNALANAIVGGIGNDVLQGGLGNDTLNGGAGTDTASYASSTAGVTVNLSLLVAQNTVGAGIDTLSAIENLLGSGFNDTLTGDGLNNVLEGHGGNDALDGLAGVDTASYASAAAAVTVNLALATAQNTLGAGTDTLANMENLLGSKFNDILTGNALANRLDGSGGADTMAGGAGNDTYVVDSSATQTIKVVNGVSTLVTAALGTAFAPDVVTEAAGSGADTVESFVNFTAPANVEILVARSLPAVFSFVPGITLVGNALNNLVIDSAGNNTLDGGAGIDTVSFQNATSGVTVFSLGQGQAQGFGFDSLLNFENVIGSPFNDVLHGTNGNNVINGGAGVDEVSYSDVNFGGVTIDLRLTTAQNTLSSGLDTLVNIENVKGGNADDRLIGNAQNNVLNGGSGSDVLEGGAGNDTLICIPDFGTDTGADTASYSSASAGVVVNLSVTAAQNTVGAGVDTLAGIENLTGSGFNDTLTGNAGDNTLVGGDGNDVLNGGAGVDIASYAVSAAGVTVDLTLTVAQNTIGAGTDTLTNIENLNGSGFNDTLSGSAANNVLEGGNGDDQLNGGAGVDAASYAGAAAAVTVDLALAAAQNTVGAGSDTLAAIENLIGSSFNDTLLGNALNNVIDGGLGDDTMDGRAGVDTLTYANIPEDFFSSGVSIDLSVTTAQFTLSAGSDTISNFENVIGTATNDTLTGNGVNNVLTGGGGIDTLTGGLGADSFVFTDATSADNINDFVSGTDKFVFSQAGIRVGNGNTTVDGGVSVAGPGGFSSAAELVIVQGDIAGTIDATRAAAAIGSATAVYGIGATAVFAVDNGVASRIFLFTSDGTDALVSATELTLVGQVNAAATALGDYVFAA